MPYKENFVLDSVNKIVIPGMETYYEINPRTSLDFVENIKTEKKLILLALKSFKTRKKSVDIISFPGRSFHCHIIFLSLKGKSKKRGSYWM